MTSRRTAEVQVTGRPTGTRAWRSHVAAELGGWDAGPAVRLDFVIAPSHWVDLDTLAHTTLQGLRDAGALRPRFAGLEELTATKRHGEPLGVRIAAAKAPKPPAESLMEAAAPVVPRVGDRDSKRAWRDVLSAAWGERPPLTTQVWVELSLPVRGALPARVEVVLDALEPVLGRDPRGRARQEFFPNDDRIVWLRVRRAASGPPRRLRLGGVRTAAE